MTHLKYLKYVLMHKWFVFVAGIRTNAPLWRLVIHDRSKFGPAEWGPYARRFYGGRSNIMDMTHDRDEFKRAWAHHWHRNPHHWECWLYLNGKEMLPMRMPDDFVREMVADWLGAGRAKTGSWNMAKWFDANKQRMIIHEGNWSLINDLVDRHGR